MANLYGRLVGDNAKHEATRMSKDVIFASLETWAQKLVLRLTADGTWQLYEAEKCTAFLATDGMPVTESAANLLAKGVLRQGQDPRPKTRGIPGASYHTAR